MHTVRHGCRLDVAVSAAQRPAFARALLEGFGSIAAALSAVDERKAEGRPGERRRRATASRRTRRTRRTTTHVV